jgi:NADH:ubiquinone oxidoreductase subunit 5 (subunit L)/multisubunit Na+/H+ antiporter MnhA subunit
LNPEILTWAIILPMIGSFFVVLLGKASYRIKAAFSLCIVTIPFILLLFIASTVSGNGSIVVKSDWLADYGVSIILYADPLGVFFALIASFFGIIAMLYSFGDMMHEEGTTRYYALMLLFSSSMIGLVMAGNFFVLYAFWELVGLCSYSLIGFYKERSESNRASFKAFFITRALGICLLLGGIVLFVITGSFDIPVVFERLHATGSSGVITLVLVLFLLAAMAKSSQLPFLWLPDATVAPSAVTSYLHAAAMVKAGVYLIARAYPMIQLISGGPYLNFLVATIGAVTLTLCSMAAWSQYDVKRVVAFSTCAQIGYMFLGIGIGTGFGAMGGIFHLLNHAVFKALLFLCAGCLLYTTGTRNLNEMGGLAKRMPLVTAAMIIGALSVVGVPPFNGFASKLIIYEAALQRGMSLGGIFGAAYVFYCALALFSSAVTFAYFMRVINSAFFGRTPQNLKAVKDVPLSMQIPLAILSILCLIFGIFPQEVLSVFVDPAVSAFTGQSISELNSSITTLGFRTGIGFYEATGLTLMILASVLVGAIIYRATSRAQPSESTNKYGVFIGGEADVPYIDVEKTRVGVKTFTYAAEKTFGDLYNFMWVGRLDQLYNGLAQGAQKFSDSFSAGVTTRLGMTVGAVAVLASFFINPSYPGALLMILGTIVALSQRNAKRLLICAISAQIGWIVLEAAFDYPNGISDALFYLLNVAVFGSLLSVSLWSVARRVGTTEISGMRGLSKKMPIAAIAFIMGGLSMSGVPPFGGWIDEFYFIQFTLEAGNIELTLIGVAVSILTLAYVLRTFNNVFLGELLEKHKDLKGSSPMEIVLIMVLIIVAILIGIAPQLFMSPIKELVGLIFS